MFKRNLFHAWFGILILSSMFLFGQEGWSPTPDCSADGWCNPECGAGVDPDCASGDPWPLLNTNKDIMSLIADDVEVHASIGVEAVDPDGDPDSFTVTSDDSCVQVDADEINREIDITVPVAAEPCTQPVTIDSGSGLTKDITIRVIDPMVMDIGDGLLIQFRNAYSWQWTWCSHGLTELSTWALNPGPSAEGWRSITGTAAHTQNWNPPVNVPSVSVNDSSAGGDLIQVPVGYTLIATTTNTCDPPFYAMRAYKPVCPSGYVALSTQTCPTNVAVPCVDTYCVKEEYTMQGQPGRYVGWFNKAGGGSGNVWEITIDPYENPDPGYAPLPVGGFIWCSGDASTCDADMLHVLKIPVETVEAHSVGEDETSFHLEDYPSHEFPVGRPFFGSAIRVPFTFIPDERSAVDENVNNYPFWSVRRVESYYSLFWYDNRQNNLPWEQSVEKCSGWEDTATTNFETAIGLDVSISGGCDLKLFNTQATVSLSTEFRWGSEYSSSWNYSECNTTTTSCPAYSICEELQMKTDFDAAPLQCLIDNQGCSKRIRLSDYFGTAGTGRENRYRFLRYPRN